MFSKYNTYQCKIDLRTNKVPVIEQKILDAIDLSESNNAELISRRILNEKYPDVDWDKVDFNNLEQDEYSLENDNILGFIKRGGNNTKHYIVYCKKCVKYTSLHGLGIYLSLKSSIKKNKKSCSCSKCFIRTEYQLIIEINKKAASYNNIFYSWIGEKLNYESKLCLFCIKKEHGKWETTTVHNILNTTTNGCKKCATNITKNNTLKSDEYHITQFMSTGAFHKNSIFKRNSIKKDKRNYCSFWDYICPICSNDEYVKKGLCNGIFTVEGSSLKSGCLPCRCSKQPRWTQHQREYQISNELKERNNDNVTYTFIKWLTQYKNGNTKFIYNCSKHGNKKISVRNCLNHYGCPQCGKHNQMETYINLIYDDNENIAIKYGKANNSLKRLVAQKRHCVNDIKNIGIWKFNTTNLCNDAENECKERFYAIIPKEEMKDGYTETTYFYNYDEIVKIYEKFGGIKIK